MRVGRGVYAPAVKPRHVLSNADPETRTGDCAVCGEGVRIRHKLNGQGLRYWVCRTATARRAPGADQRRKRLQDVRTRYGLSPEEYDALVELHGARCAACGAGGVLAVDHCHRTGAVRGLLCGDCNLGLGRFHDDPVRLRAAAAYLER